MGNLSYPYLGHAIITYGCDAETEFLAAINENHTKEAVQSTMTWEARSTSEHWSETPWKT